MPKKKGKRPVKKQPAKKSGAKTQRVKKAAAAKISKGKLLSFTIFCAMAFLLFVGLGVWQLKRLAWKENLIAQIVQNQNMPEMNVNDNFIPEPPEEFTFRHAAATGLFLHNQEILVQGKTFEGNRGMYLITPLMLSNGDLLIVNRGWVPVNKADAVKRPQTRTGGFKKVKGVLWKSEHPWKILPQNDPEKGLWLWMNAEELQHYFESKNPSRRVYPVILRQTVPDNGQQADLPKIPPLAFNILNDHLQYAITWFTLAGIVVVMFIIFRRKQA